MFKSIAITSGKGGTGKTSVCAGVASALCYLGFRVCIIDCDFGLRNLDLVTGLSDKVVFDFGDVISGKVDIKKALVPHPDFHDLMLLAAPMKLDPGFTPDMIGRVISKLKPSFDFCLLDSAAGLTMGFDIATAKADMAIVVATLDYTSLRDAEHTAALLTKKNCSKRYLVVNKANPRLFKRFSAIDIDTAIDTTGIQLLGVIPEDSRVYTWQNMGKVFDFEKQRNGAPQAYLNIAKRLSGLRVPLMNIKEIR